MCDPVTFAAVGSLASSAVAGIGSAAAGIGAAATTVGTATAGLSWLAPVAAIAGGALNAYGQVQQGNYANKLAQYNAAVAKQSGDYAVAIGEQKATERRIQAAGKAAAAQSAIAGGNIDIGVGSPLDIVGNEAYYGELDAQTIMQNAYAERSGFQNKSANLLAEGGQAKKDGQLGAFSTALTTVSSARKDFPDFFKRSA